MLQGKDFYFSDLSKFKVVDKEGSVCGKPSDALFNKSDLSFHSLILFGSIIEEKMEDMGLKEDVDPIVPMNLITEQDFENKTFKLSVSKSDLKTTTNDYTPPEGTFQFTKFKKVPVFDKDEDNIGRVIDIYFQKGGKYILVIGGSKLEEFLERIKVFADKDLLVPKVAVESLSDERIVIHHSKQDLKTTVMESFSPDQIIASDNIGFVPRGYHGP